MLSFSSSSWASGFEKFPFPHLLLGPLCDVSRTVAMKTRGEIRKRGQPCNASAPSLSA